MPTEDMRHVPTDQTLPDIAFVAYHTARLGKLLSQAMLALHGRTELSSGEYLSDLPTACMFFETAAGLLDNECVGIQPTRNGRLLADVATALWWYRREDACRFLLPGGAQQTLQTQMTEQAAFAAVVAADTLCCVTRVKVAPQAIPDPRIPASSGPCPLMAIWPYTADTVSAALAWVESNTGGEAANLIRTYLALFVGPQILG